MVYICSRQVVAGENPVPRVLYPEDPDPNGSQTPPVTMWEGDGNVTGQLIMKKMADAAYELFGNDKWLAHLIVMGGGEHHCWCYWGPGAEVSASLMSRASSMTQSRLS